MLLQFNDERAEQGPAVPHTFGFVANTFLSTFVLPYKRANKDPAQRVRIVKSILEAVKTESEIDFSWWTENNIKDKLKKMARKVNTAD